jgi:7-cyano-7-deazaguanine synthase in queuosine biosynthesis
MENLKKVVVLFSGGIDSLACLQWARLNINKIGSHEIVALYVNMNTRYSEIEIAASQALIEEMSLVSQEIVDLKFLGEYESSPLGHIPMRNIFLLECAALYGDDIVFGMLRGELSEDKNPAFIKLMQQLFDSQVKKNFHNKGKTVTIHTPFDKSTKTQVVEWLLAHDITQKQIGQTIGCLKGNCCGECMSCFNRWIALENNGIGELDVYQNTHPSEWGVKNFKEIRDKDALANRAVHNVSLWQKKNWLADVYNAYRSAHDRGIVEETPFEMIRKNI